MKPYTREQEQRDFWPNLQAHITIVKDIALIFISFLAILGSYFVMRKQVESNRKVKWCDELRQEATTLIIAVEALEMEKQATKTINRNSITNLEYRNYLTSVNSIMLRLVEGKPTHDKVNNSLFFFKNRLFMEPDSTLTSNYYYYFRDRVKEVIKDELE